MTELLSHRLYPPVEDILAHWMVIIHGFLGSKKNWTSFCQAFQKEIPSVGLLVVDLPCHGENTWEPQEKMSIHYAANCIDELCASLKIKCRAIMGHSLGAKVGLSLAAIFQTRIENVFILDSTPYAVPKPEVQESYEILKVLMQAPTQWKKREHFVSFLMDQGISQATGEWLAMNLVQAGDELKLLLNIPALEEFLLDFYHLDCSATLNALKDVTRFHFIKGSKSKTTPKDKIEKDFPFAHHYVVPGDHWVHANAPSEIIQICNGVLV